MPANRSALSQPGTRSRTSQRAELAEARALSAMLDLNPDGLLAFDGHGRVIQVSAAFEALTGLGAAQLIGLAEEPFWALLSGLCNPQRPENGVAALRQHLAQPDNQRRHVLELITPAACLLRVFQRQDDQAGMRVLCFRDATRELDIDRRKSEFLSTAAHELRAPLACIYGFAENLLYQPCDAAMQKEFIGIIHQQANAMAVLLDEMLDLERIEARRQTDLVFEQVSARRLVLDVLRAFQPLPERDLPVLLDGGPELPIRVDVLKARQVLQNVLSNAYKYSPGGGPVQIAIEAQPAADSAPPEVLIRIQDQGVGMSPAQLARVFERFYRAHVVTHVPGAGLGLNIAQGIMQLMNGRITIDSRVGAGTSVSLHFPAV